MKTPVRPVSIVMIPDRNFLGSLELYLYCDLAIEKFYTFFCTKEKGTLPVAYAEWSRVGSEVICSKSQGIFQLTELLPGHMTVPGPVVSLSGVLWSRQAALEAHRSISSYQAQVDRMP